MRKKQALQGRNPKRYLTSPLQGLEWFVSPNHRALPCADDIALAGHSALKIFFFSFQILFFQKNNVSLHCDKLERQIDE